MCIRFDSGKQGHEQKADEEDDDDDFEISVGRNLCPFLCFRFPGMSGYENVIGGKLKLKGKALDVKAAGIKKKKKKQNKNKSDGISILTQNDLSSGRSTDLTTDPNTHEEEAVDSAGKSREENGGNWDANMTPAERRYVEQRERIDQHRLAKTANKSHRDRIQDFNQYLANMSEHYDIPKVGPG